MPAGIRNAKDCGSEILAPKEEDDTSFRYEWPWAEVTAFLGPMLPGQAIYHVTGTGVGKTSGWRR